MIAPGEWFAITDLSRDIDDFEGPLVLWLNLEFHFLHGFENGSDTADDVVEHELAVVFDFSGCEGDSVDQSHLLRGAVSGSARETETTNLEHCRLSRVS